MTFDQKEFKEFLESSPIEPPKGISESIFQRVRTDLHPSALGVFSKVMLIHFFSALVTLSFCPQFGFRFFGEDMGLMGLFMNLGPYGCMAACGAFFVGSSLLATALVLRAEEIQTLRRYRWLQLAALVSLSLGAFIMLDAEIVIGFGLAWAIGSFLGGFSMLELGWILKRKLALT